MSGLCDVVADLGLWWILACWCVLVLGGLGVVAGCVLRVRGCLGYVSGCLI